MLHELASDDRPEGTATALPVEPAASTTREGTAEQQKLSAPFRATIAIGMHLCGALSPRLLALASHIDSIDAVAVAPCCLKGTLGDHVKKLARASSRDNYEVLLETLSELTKREIGSRGVVEVRRDDELLSPRNGFVSAIKMSTTAVLNEA